MRLFTLFTFGVAAVVGTSENFPYHNRDYALQTPLDDAPSRFRSGVLDSKTIYHTLKDNQQYSKLVKAVDFVGDDVIDILNDTSTHITFFASPNKALDHTDDEHSEVQTVGLPKAIQLLEELETFTFRRGKSDKKHRDSKRKKRLLRKALRAILYYHILPSDYDTTALINNNTFDTELVLPGVLDKRSLRIRVTRGIIPPTPIINLYSKVIEPNIHASNGVIHGIELPLLPPPSIFQELFMGPSMFSILTSAVQRTGLANDMDFRYVHHPRKSHHDKHSFKGISAVTVFAPTNAAFLSLPSKLRLFLFSPLGERALRKILEYHIVPDYVFHTDYRFNATSLSVSGVIPKSALQSNLIFSYNRTLPTALEDCPLHAHAEKFNITIPIPGPNRPFRTKTNLFINNRPVRLPDVVGLNGAFHVIDSVLDPRACHKHHDEHGESWEDWEGWLEAWSLTD